MHAVTSGLKPLISLKRRRKTAVPILFFGVEGKGCTPMIGLLSRAVRGRKLLRTLC